jgi:hypothetical protein
MATLLHFSFRVKAPARSAALYADLLDGHVVSIGPPLGAIGVLGSSGAPDPPSLPLDTSSHDARAATTPISISA